MKKLFNPFSFFRLAVFGAVLLTPMISLAATDKENIPPELIQFGDLLTFISRYVRVLGYSLAVVAFIYAGFLYFTAYGDESKPTKAKQVFIAVIAGLAIIIVSEIVVHATLNTVAAPENVNITNKPPVINEFGTGGQTGNK